MYHEFIENQIFDLYAFLFIISSCKGKQTFKVNIKLLTFNQNIFFPTSMPSSLFVCDMCFSPCGKT